MGSIVFALAAVVFAAVMQWRNWSWKYNLGIRLASLAVLYAGSVLNTYLGGPLRTVITWLAGMAGQLIGAAIALIGEVFDVSVPNAGLIGEAVGSAAPWIIGAVLCVIWIAAILPDRIVPDKIDWQAMWWGIAIPMLVLTVPGRMGEILSSAVIAASGWGDNIMSTLLGA